ncbi:MAG: amidohydrolase family protein [Candidatus Binatia bacterium]
MTGFGGTLFSEAKDRELGPARVRAWNDWVYEERHRPYPERIIPLGITFLADAELELAPVIGADRIVWASDYPHLDATFPGVVRELEEHLASLPPDVQEQVRGANAARLYGLTA